MSEAIAGVAIRPEAAFEVGAVRTLLREAFAGPAEADLVDALRHENEMVAAFVAEAETGIVGHIAFSRVEVHTDDPVWPAIALGPLAVAESHRRRGIGTALVRVGLEVLTADGETIVFVLGDPAYYARFGFTLEAAASFTSTYAGPHFMARPLAPDVPQHGQLRYAAAFASL